METFQIALAPHYMSAAALSHTSVRPSGTRMTARPPASALVVRPPARDPPVLLSFQNCTAHLAHLPSYLPTHSVNLYCSSLFLLSLSGLGYLLEHMLLWPLCRSLGRRGVDLSAQIDRLGGLFVSVRPSVVPMMVYVSAFCPSSMSLLFQTERESGWGYSCARSDAAASQGRS